MRTEQKKSLRLVEEYSGVNIGTISLIERGLTHNAGIENIEAIANVLGQTIVFQPINPIHLPSQGTTETHIEETLD